MFPSSPLSSPPPPAIINENTTCPSTNIIFEKEEQDPILFTDGTNTNNININTSVSPTYTDLLHDITSLQTDLQEAKLISTKLAKDNQSLLQQKNSSTRESQELRARLELSKHALQSQIRSTCLREKEIQILESKWRSTVDKEREEVEKERQDVWEKSNHLEQMQRQVRDDVEKEFEGTIEVMRKELQDVNENRHQIHRDYEVFKAKHAITLQNALQNAKTATQARENEAAAFALNLEKLVEADKASSQKLRALALEHKECQLRMKQMTQFQCELQSELREALEDKNRCEISVLEFESRYAMKFKEVQAKNALLECELQTLRSQVKDLRNGLNDTNTEMQDTKSKLTQNQHNLKIAQIASNKKDMRIEDTTKRAQMEKERFEQQLKTQQAMSKKEKDIILCQNQQLKIDLEEKQACFEKFRRATISSEEQNVREFQASLTELTIKNATIEKDYMILKNVEALKETESEVLERDLEQALGTSQQEVDLLLKEKECLSGQSRQFEHVADGLKAELLEARDDVDQLGKDLDKKGTELTDVCAQRDLLSSQLKKEKKAGKEASCMIQKQKKMTDAYKQKAIEAHKECLQVKMISKMSQQACAD